MQGRRIDNPPGLPAPGDYGKVDGHWYACAPRCMPCAPNDGHGLFVANLGPHDVMEHEDGTLTSPSILIARHGGQWHGYLERGVWRECSTLMTDEQSKALEQLRETCRSIDTALNQARDVIGILGSETDPEILRRAWAAFFNARGIIDTPELKEQLVDYQRSLSPHTITKNDLVYAATMKCECGARLAHVRKDHRLHKPEWACSDVLLGYAIPKGTAGSVKHSAVYPFHFFDLKAAS